MKTIAYRCKMCGKEGNAEMACSEEEMKVLGFDLSVWVSMLTCNRCYDFRENYSSIIDRIFRLCRIIEVSTASKREKISAGVREQLTAQTKRLVTLLAAHFNQQNVWDAAIVDGLMEKPEQAAAQLNQVYHAIRKGLWARATQPDLVPEP